MDTEESLIVDGRGSSLAGIDLHYEAVCKCGATDFAHNVYSCEPDSCWNNGTCVEHWNGYE